MGTTVAHDRVALSAADSPREPRGARPEARGASPASGWLPREGAALVVLGLAAVVGRLGGGLGSPTGQLVLVTLVVLFGIPHGALDHRIAMALAGGTTLGRTLAFVVRYLALMALVVLAWNLWPTASLVTFLGVTVLHFGLGDARRVGSPGWLDVGVRGGLPILLPVALHPMEVSAPFAVLASLEQATVERFVVALAPWLLGLWSLGLIAHLTAVARSSRARAREDLVELTALGAVFLLLPPLSAFLVYFCAWHAARHSVKAVGWIRAQGYASTGRLTLETVGLWLGAVALLAAVWKTAPPEVLASPSDAAVRALFIGLAALTAPHVLLIDGRARPVFRT